MLARARGERRAVSCGSAARSAGSPPRTPGLYRDALGAVPPGGLPERSSPTCPTPLERLVRRYARTHGPFTTGELRERYGVDLEPVLAALERAGRPRARRAAPRRHASASGATPRSCAGCAAPRSPRCARRSSPPTSARSRASCRAGRASTATRRRAPGVDRLREALVPLQGLALPAEVWERDVLPRRIGAYSPAWMDQLCASGEVVWVGAGALGAQRAGSRSTSARTRRCSARPGRGARARREPSHDAIRERLRAGAVLLHRPAGRPARSRPRSCRRRCGTSCGPAR